MDGWRGRKAALFCRVLQGAGIKALHISTITREEKKKEERKDVKRWKMTSGPFISPRAGLPSLTNPSFFSGYELSSLSHSLSFPQSALSAVVVDSHHAGAERQTKTHEGGSLDILTLARISYENISFIFVKHMNLSTDQGCLE